MKYMSFLHINDVSTEFLRSELEDLYGRELSEILGAIGPMNQFNSHMQILNEEETRYLTNHYDENAMEKLIKYRQNKAKEKKVDLVKEFHENLFFHDLAN